MTGSRAKRRRKARWSPGQLADLAVLTADYFSIPEERIKSLESVLTMVGGKVVYGSAEFRELSPPPLAVMPEWSPVARYRGYGGRLPARAAAAPHHHAFEPSAIAGTAAGHGGLWGSGCDCFAF
jgi:hypothetical protein